MGKRLGERVCVGEGLAKGLGDGGGGGSEKGLGDGGGGSEKGLGGRVVRFGERDMAILGGGYGTCDSCW